MAANHFYTNFFRRGNNLYMREVVNGVKTQRKLKIEPEVYVVPSTHNGEHFMHEDSYTTVTDEPLVRVDKDNLKEARDFIKEYQASGRDVYGFDRWEYNTIDKLFPGQDGIEWHSRYINISALDIETECENGFPDIETANEAINAITISGRGSLFVFGMFDLDENSEYKLPENALYKRFDTEEQMLEAFVKTWEFLEIDIITGWNIDKFDLPYLYQRILNLLGEEWLFRMSPWGFVDRREQYIMGQLNFLTNFAGIAIIDYIDIYKKFKVKMQESYKLDHIAFVELGEKKLDYSEHDSLHELYRNDYTKFIVYNVKDVTLIQRLEEKLKFINLCMVIAYFTKTNFTDVFSNVRIWDVVIANYLRAQGKMVHIVKGGGSKDDAYEGAYVKIPQVGKYDYIGSFDLTSLYPSLIMTYNISPDVDTYQRAPVDNIDSDFVAYNDEGMKEITEYLKKSNLTMASNGTLYRRGKPGFLAELMQQYFNYRKDAKNKMLDAKNKIQEIDRILEARGEA